ncbi:MAG: O-antigen ligase family protein [Flavobacteriales bacterium]|nr:O-antigen ligase family protein [Flavobacteriales bacterium]
MTVASSGLLRGHDVFRVVHVGALALCAIMLPWSTAILSVAQMLLVANWLVEGIVRKDIVQRFRRAFTWAPSLVFLSFYFLHIIGLVWTDDLKWGMDLLRILLPVLSFGPALATAPRLQRKAFDTMLLLGAWSVVASTFACLLLTKGDAMDYRSLSVFISHIRLSMLLCLAVVVFVIDRSAPRSLRLAGYAMACWALYFINELGSLQGFFMLGAIAVVAIWRMAAGLKRPWSSLIRVAMLLIPATGVVWMLSFVRANYRLPDPAIAESVERTAGGDYYTYDLTNPQMENGTHVWTYLAWREMERTWPLRSTHSLQGNDERGHPMWSTLVRFLASKGQRKDSVGVMGLSDDEVRAIERGIPSAVQEQRSEWRERVDEVAFELAQYKAYGKAEGHSVAMRLEYLKAGWSIAKENWSFGVGTGDTQRAFDAQYERMGSSLSKEWRHRAHNEYLTLWISFGVFGLLLSLIAWCWPAWRLGAWRSTHFIAWAIIFGISCLTDDTIETQAGATFFGLFYTLFVYAAPLDLKHEYIGSAPTHASA